MFGFSGNRGVAAPAMHLVNALTRSTMPSAIPLPLQLLANALGGAAYPTPQRPSPTAALPQAQPRLQPYIPTQRDKMASWMLDHTGNSPTAQNLVEGLLGSIGTGQTKTGVADLIPFLGQALQSDQAGRQMANGHPVAGLANAALAALPIPAVGRVAKGAFGFAGKPIEHAVEAALPAAEQGAAAAAPIIAYHGSPHTFDAFDLSKIGTGEGAQAYGHGLYFAENEKVAQSYRNALASTLSLDGKPIYQNGQRLGTTGDGTIDAMLINNGGDIDKAMADPNYHLAPVGGGDKRLSPYMQQQLEALRGRVSSDGGGSTYQVGIHATPEHFLDWDAPLSEQHPVVQQAVSPLLDPMAKAYGSGPLTTQTTGDTYRRIADRLGPDTFAQRLSDAGVPGIKYLDQGSRGAGDGTRNYVVFDPANVDILKRYGIPVGVMGGGMGAALGVSPQDGQQQPTQGAPQ